jgi:hypothetical protein
MHRAWSGRGGRSAAAAQLSRARDASVRALARGVAHRMAAACVACGGWEAGGAVGMQCWRSASTRGRNGVIKTVPRRARASQRSSGPGQFTTAWPWPVSKQSWAALSSGPARFGAQCFSNYLKTVQILQFKFAAFPNLKNAQNLHVARYELDKQLCPLTQLHNRTRIQVIILGITPL